MFLPAGDLAGIQRLIQYMTRCPFSLSRLVKVTMAALTRLLISSTISLWYTGTCGMK